MCPVITVKEYESLLIGELGELNEQHIESLRKLETTLPRGAFSWRHNSVKFSQFCGVIQLADQVIEILPKIYGAESDSDSSREILVKMLYSSQHLLSRQEGHADIRLQRHNLLDVFISYFCDLLFRQLQQGLIRLYQHQSENLTVVRGRINLPRHFNENVAHKQRVFCDYDELSVDNGYNQAIKATTMYLYTVARNLRLRQRLNELLFIFADVSDRNVTSQMVRALHRNKLVDRFETIFQLCEWFLAGRNPDVYAGNIKGLSLLFDMNRLFESYVAIELRQVCRKFDLKVRTQGPQRYLARDTREDRELFLMKPDISLIGDGNKPIAILDTKWKLLDPDERKYGISQADIYQMLAYAHQYDCKELVLIYPKRSKLQEMNPEFVTKTGGIHISVWTLDLKGLVGEAPQITEQLSAKLGQLLAVREIA